MDVILIINFGTYFFPTITEKKKWFDWNLLAFG